MSLRDSIKNDAVSVFLSVDEFAETIIYNPRGGGSRSILAIVNREPPSLFDELGNVVSVSFMVYVANDPATGISSTEVDAGGDKIRIAEAVNDLALKSCSILRVMDNDHGMLQLAIR